MWIKEFFGKVVKALFRREDVETAVGHEIAMSSKMEQAINLWSQMYEDAPPWKNAECQTMNLPAAIAHEFTRLITVENEFSITGSPFADFLNENFARCFDKFENVVELYCAKGGIAMKPYVNGEQIEVDFTQADCFFPTEHDSNGKITGAIFVDHYRNKKYLYTRLEKHTFTANQKVTEENGTERMVNVYVVENRAFRSEELFDYGSGTDMMTPQQPLKTEVPLAEVPQWSSLTPIVTINDLDKPLFVYVKVPGANNVDSKSPLGASVYAKAVNAIRNCDEQYSESKFEFEALEAAIDADQDLFKKRKDGTPILPTGKERVFRAHEARTSDGAQPFFREFAPSFRDTSLFNGLDHYLKIVEFLTELTFGTISDPTTVEKTATEIISSKQRSYSAVCNMQKAWDDGLHDLVYSMASLATLYNLVPYGEYELNITWGDGIMEDMNVEYQRRWSMVMAGKLKLERFYSWYFGISEEEALEMIPAQEPIPAEEF